MKIKDYLKNHPSPLIFSLIAAHEGQPELLEKIVGSESGAFSLLSEARFYGNVAKQYPAHDYPIALSNQNGAMTKMLYRMAGLVIAGQKTFCPMEVNRPPEIEPNYKLTKEEKTELSNFIELLFKDPLKTPDSASLDSPITTISKSSSSKK